MPPQEQSFLPLPQHFKTETLEISGTGANFDSKSCGYIIFNQKAKVKEEIVYFESLALIQVFHVFQKLPRLLDFFIIVLLNYLNNAGETPSCPLQDYSSLYQSSFPSSGKSLPLGSYPCLTRYCKRNY